MNLSYTKQQGQYDTNIELMILNEAHSRELKVFFKERKKGKTHTPLQSCFRKKISLAKLQALSKEIYSLLYRSAHSTEKNDKGIVKRLQQIGLDLYNSIFPLEIKKKLSESNSQNLHLTIDDSLISVPWELIHDGETFFSLRFNMGREVYTSHSVVNPKTQKNKKIRMLILADPKRDLPESYEEGKYLHQELYDWDDSLTVFFKTNDITTQQVSREILDYDIIHFAGHVIYDTVNPGMSGWVLENGILNAQDIMQLAGCKKPLPWLVFSNACQSGQTSEWSKKEPEEYPDPQALDLVNAFLRCGVLHYIGTFQDVRDRSSFYLALNFYQFMTQSYTIGEALRLARLKIMKEGQKYGANNLIWAYYMLYGNPTISYLGRKEPETVSRDIGYQRLQTYQYNDQKMQEGEKQWQDLVVNAQRNIYMAQNGLTRTGGSDAGEKFLHTPSKKKIHKDQHPPTEDKKRGSQAEKTGNRCKWTARVLWIGAVLFLIIAGIFLLAYIFRHPEYDNIKSATDPVWEEKKWQVVQNILEKLKQRYPEYPSTNKNVSNDTSPGDQPVTDNAHSQDRSSPPFTLCIIPAIPREKDKITDNRITEQIIEELIQFFALQPDCTPVERDRLDFVLKELEMATSDLSESKLQFALGRILGTKAILFVRVFKQTGRFPFPFFNQKTDVYIRYVDTQTSAIKAGAELSFKDENIKLVSKRLGEKILLALNKS